MSKIAYTTLGCKLNFSESAAIIRQFVEKGYEIVPYGQEADITIINTCAVTAQAERKSKLAVKKASKISADGKIVVIGCAAQLRPENFAQIQGVDLILGAKDKFNAIELLKTHNEQKIYSCDIDSLEGFDNAFSVNERTRSFLKIQDGCDYACSYCTIPKARGKSRNAPIKDIVSEAKIIAQSGVKEIILTGVNIGDFGKSTDETFFELIKELDKVQPIERFRISSIEPNLLTDQILEFIANHSQKFMPHFHIPLQSGSDKVLKLMKRRYNTEKFKNRILKAKKMIPDVFLGIDVIVGFPGEREIDFQNTYNLLESLPISYLHLFPYSDREGTVSADIKHKVPSEWKKIREHKLKALSDKKHKEFCEKYLGSTRKVLFEGKTKNNRIAGYTDNYIRVSLENNQILPNSIHEVKLLEIVDDEIWGELNIDKNK